MIFAVPDDIPETTPPVPIIATATLLLLQVPPVVTVLYVMVFPTQTFVGPVIDTTVGKGLTVTTDVTEVLHPNPLETV